MLCLAGCLNTNTQSFLSRLSRSSLAVGNQLPIRQTRCSPWISTQTPPPLQDQSSTSLDVYWALASRPLRFYFSTRWCMLVSHACWRSLGIFWDSTGVEVISNGVQFRKKRRRSRAGIIQRLLCHFSPAEVGHSARAPRLPACFEPNNPSPSVI